MEREPPSRKFPVENRDLMRIFEGGKEEGRGQALPERAPF